MRPSGESLRPDVESSHCGLEKTRIHSKNHYTYFLVEMVNMYLFYEMDVKVMYTSISRGPSSVPNAIAFDLDETIGSFSDFYSIWARLEPSMKTQQIFEEIMDLYPEFLRVGIYPILRYIRTKQEVGCCLPVYIYTNNQCEDVSWIYQLIDYLETRVFSGKTVKIFARPICAFKINGRIIELGRTTHEKTYSDFVRCSMLSTSHELCFIDDIYHKKMKNRRVYYIQPPPYVHSLSYKKVVDRFLASAVYRKLYPTRCMESNEKYGIASCSLHDSSDISCLHNPCISTSAYLCASATPFESAKNVGHELRSEPTRSEGEISLAPLTQRGTAHLYRKSNHDVQIEEWNVRNRPDKSNEKEEQKITNKIMYHIREFFLISSRRRATKKNTNRIGNFSRKKKVRSIMSIRMKQS